MNQTKATQILQKLAKAIPNPAIELDYSTPFELLVAVVLSAQATDVSVNKVTAKLFPKANTPEKILALGQNGLEDYIKSIGLYKTKATNILKTCQLLIDKHNSKVPNNREDLEALAGVGRKSANIILNVIFNQPTIAVDRHIFRVCNRTKLAEGKNPLEVEKKLLQIVPKNLIHNAHHLLLLHGRYTCIAKKPKCKECVINSLCEYEHKTFTPA